MDRAKAAIATALRDMVEADERRFRALAPHVDASLHRAEAAWRAARDAEADFDAAIDAEMARLRVECPTCAAGGHR